VLEDGNRVSLADQIAAKSEPFGLDIRMKVSDEQFRVLYKTQVNRRKQEIASSSEDNTFYYLSRINLFGNLIEFAE
jgi:hypothetical protein